MDKKFGYYVFGGLLIGALLGRLWSASANSLMGIVIGAVAGLAVGWFIAAAVMERTSEKKKDK